ncbi:hypothetical protein CENSYa_0288 [Cenarchaeum symbiosum A]|uniref:RecA/RadA recombinase n=1 Tax=Cenarchaeum symbiosum (strain A) TaxID=414004 RepID=A0RUB0_CENSY|nr:hypothetical protein CENSYa_0288 [Cenarchaeum symbiosum A]
MLPDGRVSSVICTDPYLKASFLDGLASCKSDVHYLDLDLLYSGMVSAGILPRREITVYRPGTGGLYSSLDRMLGRASSAGSLIIIDTLNGLFNILEDRDAGRMIDSYIMLLGLACRSSGSRAVMASMSLRRDGAWALSPTGRRVIGAGTISTIRLEREGRGATAYSAGGGSVISADLGIPESNPKAL